MTATTATATTATATTRPPADVAVPRPRSFRPDIQGLRAFAVIVVILDHLLGWPPGGFIGVDVFFVISGFLISGSLVREAEVHGWIRFTSFYAARARRILPAAVTVLLVTVIGAFLLWPTGRAADTLGAAIASLFFVGNWHFAAVGTDYLQADGPVSPLQHYWSLGVEEQFYLLWPWLVIAVVVATARLGRQRQLRRLLLAVFLAVIGASFVLSLVVTWNQPTVAYFDTFSRVWELGAGALLSLFAGRLERLGARAGAVLQWAGLGVLVAALFVVTPASAFPGPWALAPVVGAVLVIAGGTAGSGAAGSGAVGGGLASGANPLLANRPARYLGDISYSLYLWHFPVIIFTAALVGDGPVQWVLVLVLTGVLSVVSYHQVENRFRRRRTGPTRGAAAGHRGARLPSGRRSARPATRKREDLVASGAVTVAVLVAAVVQLTVPAPAWLGGGPAASAAGAQHRTPDGAGEPWEAAFLDAAVTAAVQEESWPEWTTGQLATLGADDKAPHMAEPPAGCLQDVWGTVAGDECLREGTGEDPPVAVVVGDSVAVSWLPAVEEALPGWTVYGMGYGSCPAIPEPVGEGARAGLCAEAQQRMIDFAASVDADLVFTSAAQANLPRLASGASGPELFADWREAVTEFAARFTDTSEVIILANPPAGWDPGECVTRAGSPQDCTREVNDAWRAKAAAEAEGAAAAGATFVDTSRWICTDDGRCPFYIDGTILRFDAAHLTHAASARLGGMLAGALPDDVG